MSITGLLGALSRNPFQLERLRKNADKLIMHSSANTCLISGEEYFVYVFGRKSELTVFRDNGSQGFVVGTHSSTGAGLPDNGHFLLFQPTDRGGFSFRTDPVGLVNLYRYSDREVTIFGTSSMQIAALIPQLEFDSIGMQEFLVAGYLVSDRTYYSGVDVVPGGVDWTVNPGDNITGIEISWYQPPKLKDWDEQDIIEKLSDVTRRAARKIATDGHVCCDLTGGYDSRGVASMFLAAEVPFSTVVNGSHSLADVRIAAEIADKFDLDHYHNDTSAFMPPQDYHDVLRILMLTDGEIDIPEYYNTAQIHEITAAKGWLTVNGSGGELFRGYWWEGEWPEEGSKRQVDIDYLVKRVMSPHIDYSLFRNNEDEIKDHFRGVVKKVTEEAGPDQPSGRRIDMLYLKVRMGRWLARFYSSTQKILPCYSPFLTKPAIDIALAIPPKAKKRVQFYRKWLMANHCQLAMMPLENGAPAIPCTLTTAWRFHHYPVYVARKIIDRSRRTFFPNSTVRKSLSPLEDAFLRIGSLETGSCCFTPPVKSLIRHEAADRFGRLLADADPHINISQLSRLLTIDLTVREVLKLRSMLDAECPSGREWSHG